MTRLARESRIKRALTTLGTLVSLGATSACEMPGEVRKTVEQDASPSPNASILPTPLASAPLLGPRASSSARGGPAMAPAGTGAGGAKHPITVTTGAAAGARSGDERRGPPGAGAGSAVAQSSAAPAPMPVPDVTRVGESLPVDSIGARETAGIAMQGEWRWVEPGIPPRGPEVSLDGIAAARRTTAFRWSVLATESGRLRISMDSRAFPVVQGTELRARSDVAGHVLLSSNGTEYRVALPGSLRALFLERRLDVLPLAAPEPISRSALGARFGAAVRRIEIASKVGRLTMDLARFPEAGAGAALLCRTLVELAAIDPALAGCNRDELPIRAHLSWPGSAGTTPASAPGAASGTASFNGNGGGVVFDALEVVRRGELPLTELQCPPPSATLATTAMPPLTSVTLLTREEASAFRARPIDVPVTADAPNEGLRVHNEADTPRYLVIDGIPVAWVTAGGELHVPGLARGRYSVQWRTFLGDLGDPPLLIEIPARLGWPASTAPVVSSAASARAPR